MKVSEAQEKVCPFIYNNQNSDLGNDGGHINCICNDCMAWIITKTHERIENKSSSNSKEVCMSGYIDGKQLPDCDKEGICARLSR